MPSVLLAPAILVFLLVVMNGNPVVDLLGSRLRIAFMGGGSSAMIRPVYWLVAGSDQVRADPEIHIGGVSGVQDSVAMRPQA